MLGGVFRLYSFREADGAKGSAGRKTLASFCLNPIGSCRGQSLLVSEAFSCATERRTRRPVIEIFKLPVVSRIRVRWRPRSVSPVYILVHWTPAGHFQNEAEASPMVRRIRDKRSKAAVRGWTGRCAKRPSWFQSDEACRSVIGGTRPPARGCFAKPTHRDCTPPTLGPNCRLQRGVQRI